MTQETIVVITPPIMQIMRMAEHETTPLSVGSIEQIDKSIADGTLKGSGAAALYGDAVFGESNILQSELLTRIICDPKVARCIPPILDKYKGYL